MARSLAIARRILTQFIHDKRTLALLFVAPLVVLWLLSVLLAADTLGPRIATVDLPPEIQSQLEQTDARITQTSAQQAQQLLEDNQVDAVVSLDETTLIIQVEGTDSSKTQASLAAVNQATAQVQAETLLQAKDVFAQAQIQDLEVSYLHGSEDWKMFDYFGPAFIVIFLFAFTFITSGMSLVNEKSAGTMTRFLATPVRPLEILGGYVMGFGVLALAQTTVILAVALGLIGFPNEGNLALVIIVGVSTAMASVTLGLLVSGLASTSFQVIQLMLLFVVPQILLSGLFDLAAAPGWLQALSQFLPVTYAVDALRAIMLRGSGLASVGIDLVILWGFVAAFFLLAALRFRKKVAKRPARP